MDKKAFLHYVAYGKQDESEHLLKKSHDRQALLLEQNQFTDYSGRTFNCTAYEYAYWAKDTHMCRMLESYMDDETKAQMLARIDGIESKGLTYRQNDTDYRSAHFDFEPLKNALKAYVDSFDTWYFVQNWQSSYKNRNVLEKWTAFTVKAINAAWFAVGKAQRDIPAHVAHEYCRPDRSFEPTPQFNETTLPRVLDFENWTTSRDNSWFPLKASRSGLGFDFALTRCGVRRAVGWSGNITAVRVDLAAITRLDEVRTIDLTQSRENLNSPAISQRPKA